MPSIYAAYPYKNLELDRQLPRMVAASSKAELGHRLKEWPATEWKVYWRQVGTTKADIVDLVTDSRRVMEQGKLFYMKVNEEGGVKTQEPDVQGVLNANLGGEF